MLKSGTPENADFPHSKNLSFQGWKVFGDRLYFLHNSAVLMLVVSDSSTILVFSDAVHFFIIRMNLLMYAKSLCHQVFLL